MSADSALPIQEVIRYVQTLPGLFSQQASLKGNEIGDGNMNFVFRVRERCEHGKSVIVKQALPYMRSVGATWPLTVDRIQIRFALTLCF